MLFKTTSPSNAIEQFDRRINSFATYPPPCIDDGCRNARFNIQLLIQKVNAKKYTGRVIVKKCKKKSTYYLKEHLEE